MQRCAEKDVAVALVVVAPGAGVQPGASLSPSCCSALNNNNKKMSLLQNLVEVQATSLPSGGGVVCAEAVKLAWGLFYCTWP